MITISKCHCFIGARTKSILAQIGLTRQVKLSPKAKVLYNKVRTLRHNLSNIKSARRQIFKLSKQERILEHLSAVNELTQKFIISQLNTQKLKPRGRRFSVDDKILGLALYKTSAKAYRVWSDIFSMPSRKTLTTLLNKLPFRCGINSQVFRHLKTIVEKKKTLKNTAVWCSMK